MQKLTAHNAAQIAVLDRAYAQFSPTGSGFTAHVPMQPGAGGAVRPGWFTNLYQYNILDWKTQEDIDAAGSTPANLVTNYQYDPNGNLITITKPMGNIVEYDYDERDLRIAQRVGFDASTTDPVNGAITIWTYDGNGNLLSVIGPVSRGYTTQTLTASTAIVSGSFTLSFNGSTTSSISGVMGGTTGAAIQSALEALAPIGTGNVVVSDPVAGTGTTEIYSILFTGALAHAIQPLLAVASNTTPATVSVAYSPVMNLLSMTLNDGFAGDVPLTHGGDYVIGNEYDGFDRLVHSTDAVGNVASVTYDPDGRAIATSSTGPVGGPTPTDRTASMLVLASGKTNFDEAGRSYESQNDVFVETGLSLNALPSGRNVQHTEGGLTSNSTTNTQTHTVTLTTTMGTHSTYVLTRTVYDRDGRVIATAADNTALAAMAYDGASRAILMTDPIGNSVATDYDNNGNATQATRTDVYTNTGIAAANEIFRSAMFYDCLNRPTVAAMQGPDGTFVPARCLLAAVTWNTFAVSGPPWRTATGTIFSFTGYDSRSNQTVSVDPNANSTLSVYDGASRFTETQHLMRLNGDGGNGPEVGGSFQPASQAVIRTKTLYDANSRVTALIDDRGAQTSYGYDLLDRQTLMTFQDGSTRASSYDLANDVTGYTDENGSVFANTYDSLGRRTATAITPAMTVSTTTTAQSFEYDGLSRLTKALDGDTDTVEVHFNYDSLGRVGRRKRDRSNLAVWQRF